MDLGFRGFRGLEFRGLGFRALTTFRTMAPMLQSSRQCDVDRGGGHDVDMAKRTRMVG